MYGETFQRNSPNTIKICLFWFGDGFTCSRELCLAPPCSTNQTTTLMASETYVPRSLPNTLQSLTRLHLLSAGQGGPEGAFVQESLKNPMCVNYFMHVSSKIYDKSSKSWSLQHQILFWSPFCFLPSSFAFLESQNHSFPGFVPICPLLDPFLDHLFVYFLAVLHISRSQKRSKKMATA